MRKDLRLLTTESSKDRRWAFYFLVGTVKKLKHFF